MISADSVCESVSVVGRQHLDGDYFAAQAQLQLEQGVAVGWVRLLAFHNKLDNVIIHYSVIHSKHTFYLG